MSERANREDAPDAHEGTTEGALLSKGDLLHELIPLVSKGVLTAAAVDDYDAIRRAAVRRRDAGDADADADAGGTPADVDLDAPLDTAECLHDACNRRQQRYHHRHTVLTHAVREAYNHAPPRGSAEVRAQLLELVRHLAATVQVDLARACTAVASGRHTSPLRLAETLALDEVLGVLCAEHRRREEFGGARPGEPLPDEVSAWQLRLSAVLDAGFGDGRAAPARGQAATLTRHVQLGCLHCAQRSTAGFVFNCAYSACGDNSALHAGKGQRYAQIDAEDDEFYPLIDSHLEEFTAFLLKAEEADGSALVHCRAGVNRSAGLCCAYLMQTKRMSLMQAVSHVFEQRPIVLTNREFRRQLIVLAHKEGLLE